MLIEARTDYADLKEEAKRLGKMIRGIMDHVKSGRTDLIGEYIADCRRFDRGADSAWTHYVEE